MKRYILGVLAVAIVWQVMDFVIHGVILMSTYEATAGLWRPMDEMKNGFLMVVTLLVSASFVCLYSKFSKHLCPRSGALFGLIYGVGAGVSMGYGTYCVMPIPYSLALGWFLGTVAECTVGGLVMGLVVKDETT